MIGRRWLCHAEGDVGERTVWWFDWVVGLKAQKRKLRFRTQKGLEVGPGLEEIVGAGGGEA